MMLLTSFFFLQMFYSEVSSWNTFYETPGFLRREKCLPSWLMKRNE